MSDVDDASTLPYARATTIAPPLSAGSIAMLTIGAVGFAFVGGCFCIGLMIMFAPGNTGLGPTPALNWTIGQRVLAGFLFAFVMLSLIGSVSLLAVLVRRIGRTI